LVRRPGHVRICCSPVRQGLVSRRFAVAGLPCRAEAARRCLTSWLAGFAGSGGV